MHPSSVAPSPSYQLVRLEVFNWGPFAGRHEVDIDGRGTAVIGPTGSGKTTLVDALMTLLVGRPRYNLASTGGHESDRDLVSYVRGVLGGDGSDGRDEIARPGSTLTGIAATYHAVMPDRRDADRKHPGDDVAIDHPVVRLGGLLWLDGNGNSDSDLGRRWIFANGKSAEEQTLSHWLTTFHEGRARSLMRMGRETPGLMVAESKSKYLARVRKFFDVSENAFTLLNRAAGLKQLNSIDEIFRDLVLDDTSAFDRAVEVAGEFDTLAAIHAEMVTARKQRDALEPVEKAEAKRQKLVEKGRRLREHRDAIPLFYAHEGCRLWRAEIDRIEADQEALGGSLREQSSVAAMMEGTVDSLRAKYLRAGGGQVSQLEQTIQTQRQLLAQRQQQSSRYLADIETVNRSLGGRDRSQLDPPVDRQTPRSLSTEIDAAALAANQHRLNDLVPRWREFQKHQSDAAFDAGTMLREIDQERQRLAGELQSVRQRPTSNVPTAYHRFRLQLADALLIEETDLPFLAEMIEVDEIHQDWRGAIERALGGDRLRLLVPAKHGRPAMDWINHRDNRIHVRLQIEPGSIEEPTYFADSYRHKLTFRDDPMAALAQSMVAARDYHCVDSVDQLARTEHAMTRQGMMSGRHGRYEKRDHRPLESDWMTGFDNRARLDSISHQAERLESERVGAQEHATAQRRKLERLEQIVAVATRIIELEFGTIDTPSIEADLNRSRAKLDELLDPRSDASLARQRYESESAKLKDVQQKIKQLEVSIGILEKQIQDAREQWRDAEAKSRQLIAPEMVDAIRRHFKIGDDLNVKKLAEHERDSVRQINAEIAKHSGAESDHRVAMVKLMNAARNEDTGELADVGSDTEDVQHYLDRLEHLRREQLPERIKRFREYLVQSSDQGVLQLLASIDEEVARIEHRIVELNATLAKVEFRSGRYLQLRPRRVTDQSKRTLDKAIRDIRSAILSDDSGERHFRALQDVVMILRDAADNRRRAGSRALLDPRYRLEFRVVEVDTQTGKESPPRTGSQSGSGGEKELMASHILTASLSYALCPAEAPTPLYASVVLDEAFSKSSPSAAARIIDALRIFGLHPIFVTPNKEIGLLRRHTRSAVCVQRIDKRSSVMSIRWEELERMLPR